MNNQVKTDNYKALAVAIVKNAAHDYEWAMNNKKPKNEAEMNRILIDVRKFFNSDWCSFLINSDGLTLYNKIKKNYDEYGKVFVVDDYF